MRFQETERHTLSLPEAVIKQAWDDCTSMVNFRRLFPSDVEEAWRFLTDQLGAWAEARRMWCEAAGRDPDELRRRAMERFPNYLQIRQAVEAHYAARKLKAVQSVRDHRARKKQERNAA